MPTSHPMQINEILNMIMTLKPKSLLDIGVGFGKFGFLAREYLELWDGRDNYADWQRRIDGIEAHESYITPLQRQIYNTIHIGDARQVLPRIQDQYDLVLLVDIIEHFNLEDGLAILKQCLRVGHNLVVATPRTFFAQKEAFGNPFEKHQFHWQEQHFKPLAPMFVYPNNYSLILFMGQDAQAVYLRVTGQERGPIR
ncbi:MAG: class I SAM-dependent methyltransferase [Desulfarculus sp.]|nr:class I SAM-dependent methyltransferase [Desulfarculus sp.]